MKISELFPIYKCTIHVKKNTNLKCKHCAHCESHLCNSKVFFYCGIRKSKRTSNGLLKIKYNQTACELILH